MKVMRINSCNIAGMALTLSPPPGNYGITLELTDEGTARFFVPRLRQEGDG